MPKHDDRHLTTTQLSALLDNQLSAQELAICNAHLQSCQQCQSALVGLKQTVGLLQALPEPVLPRSFTLPAGVSYLQERPARQGQEEQHAPAPVRRRLWSYYAQRSLRAVSTIAAVIGLIFLLSGVLPLLGHGGGSTATTSAPSASGVAKSPYGPFNASPGNAATATAQKSLSNHQHGNEARTPITPPKASKTPTVIPTTGSSTQYQNHSVTSQPQPLLPLPDLGTPLGRQEVGFTLLVLGIIGALLTRRRQERRTR